MAYHPVPIPTRDDLAALMTSGMTAQQIADQLGVSRSSISNWKRRYKLRCDHRGRLAPQIDEARLRTLVNDGATLAGIAKSFGCAIESVVLVLERLGIRTRGQIAAAGGAQDYGQAVVHVVPSARAFTYANPFGIGL